MESSSHRFAQRAVVFALSVAPTACAEGTAVESASSSNETAASGDGGSSVGRGGAGGEGTVSGSQTSSSPSGSTGPSGTASGVTAGGGDGGASGVGGGGDGGSGVGAGPGAGGAGGDPTTTAATTTAATATAATTTAATTTASTGNNPVDQLCDAGEFVTSVDTEGVITCAPFGVRALSAMASSCYLYLGHLDDCNGCTSAPAKWGWARTGLCANGVGANGTCVDTDLGGTTVSLYGLNFDGDVDGNDKIHASLHCAEGDVSAQAGPCGVGEFISAVVDGVVTCRAASGLALGRVRTTCSLYMGWRDGCNGCTDPPEKWGRVNDDTCSNGLGADNTCTVASLGGESVRLFGLNPDGDLDGNDKLHMGLRCDDAVDDTTTAQGTCPAGMLVSGVLADGTLQCASPATETTAAFRNGCTAYYGIRDDCDGCTTAPAKWGYVRANDCQNGVGADNSCAVTSLSGQSVDLFGLNPDGDVDGNDKLYIGLSCQ